MKKEIRERYNKLTKDQQEEVLKKIIKIIKKYEDVNLQQKLEEECKLKGHDFDEWIYKSEIKSRTDVGERIPYDLFIENILNENVDDIIKTLRKRIYKDN